MTRKRFSEYALAALSGLLLAFSFAPFYRPALAWVALAPLYYAVTSCRGANAAGRRGAAAGLVFYAAALSWMPNVVHYLAFPFWSIFALWLALHAWLLKALWNLLERHGVTQRRALLWALAAGVTWTGIEYFRSELWPLRCPWLALGYSQAPYPAVYQTLSLWGVYGLSGLIAAVNAGLALLPRRSFPWLPAAVFTAVLVVSVSWGRWRLATTPAENGAPLTAALVQAESASIDEQVRYSLAPGAAGADLLVWPEYSVYVPPGPNGETTVLRYLEKKLKPSRAVTVIGAAVLPGDVPGVRRQNYALVLGPDKRKIGRYDKMQPVQFVETGLRGDPRPAPVATPLGALGIQICYDLAFESGARRVARQGARLLVTPTLDPAEWGELQHRQHSDMSSARAVETGLWLVRAASSGWSQVIDRLGFTRAALPPERRGVLVAAAYAGPGGTFYTAFGWTLAPLCLLLTLAAAAAALRAEFGGKGEHRHDR